MEHDFFFFLLLGFYGLWHQVACSILTPGKRDGKKIVLNLA